MIHIINTALLSRRLRERSGTSAQTPSVPPPHRPGNPTGPRHTGGNHHPAPPCAGSGEARPGRAVSARPCRIGQANRPAARGPTAAQWPPNGRAAEGNGGRERGAASLLPSQPRRGKTRDHPRPQATSRSPPRWGPVLPVPPARPGPALTRQPAKSSRRPSRRQRVPSTNRARMAAAPPPPTPLARRLSACALAEARARAQRERGAGPCPAAGEVVSPDGAGGLGPVPGGQARGRWGRWEGLLGRLSLLSPAPACAVGFGRRRRRRRPAAGPSVVRLTHEDGLCAAPVGRRQTRV